MAALKTLRDACETFKGGAGCEADAMACWRRGGSEGGKKKEELSHCFSERGFSAFEIRHVSIPSRYEDLALFGDNEVINSGDGMPFPGESGFSNKGPAKGQQLVNHMNI